MRKYLLSTIALAMLGLLAAPVEAQVYKWKDEQGRTVVSDTPRPGSGQQKPAISSTPSATKAADQPVTAEQSMADKELAFRKRQQEKKDAAAKAEQEKTAAEEKAENCRTAKNDLKALESGQRFALANEKGERDYLDDSRRQQQIERVRKNVQDFCN